MADQTAIDVYERDKYSEDHREHRNGDSDPPQGSPIEHDATLIDWWERAVLPVVIAHRTRSRCLGRPQWAA